LIAKVAGAAALVVAFATSASAQSGSDFLNTIDPLFSGVLAHPGNLDNTIQYAASAAAHGDIESAISTYEQLRFYNPKLGATRYQLGVLYYQLGSYARRAAICKPRWKCPTSRRGFARRSRTCSRSPTKNCSPINSPVSRKPACAIRAMPALAPDRRPCSHGGTINSAFLARPDWNWFGTVGVNYVHDFQTQTGENFEASVLAYDA
jgi:tetratricopeptide (TPR) repeat protein